MSVHFGTFLFILTVVQAIAPVARAIGPGFC